VSASYFPMRGRILHFLNCKVTLLGARQVQDLPENLGEALAGDKAHTSAFQAKMKVLSPPAAAERGGNTLQ